jgi:predicted AAA+ superfamily ATPase
VIAPERPIDYVTRVVDAELDQLLRDLPALALEGPKGVGKTATARRRARTCLALDDPAQRQLVEADPEPLTDAEPPVLVDEWQLLPPVWDVVRRAVDAGAAPGRYLLTGSASPTSPPTHSGAGRIVTVRMRPLALSERLLAPAPVSLGELLRGARPAVRGKATLTLEDYAREILASGFPGIRRLSGRAQRRQLDGYVDRIVDRDFREQGHVVRKPALLRRWLTAYAAATATTTTWEKIRDAAACGHGEKPTKATTLPYRDVLEQLWILEPLPGWNPSRSFTSRLAHPPKHHLADPALAAALLGVDVDALLRGDAVGPPIPRDGALLGHLFESLVTLSVRVYAQAAEARVFHCRTMGGRQEIDLIVERRDQRVIAIEVKLSPSVTDADVRHLSWLHRELGDALLDRVVITTGREAYRRADGVAVVPAALLGP